MDEEPLIIEQNNVKGQREEDDKTEIKENNEIKIKNIDDLRIKNDTRTIRSSYRTFNPPKINEHLNDIEKISSDQQAPYKLIKKIGNG